MSMMLAQAPTRTLQQRLDALERANAVRMYRAQLKRDLKAGRRDIVAVLTSRDERLATMKIGALLLALPKVGRVKATKILRRTAVSPSKTVGGLSARQRGEIVGFLKARS